jgi:indole-3-glycerol phosphate synthase
MTNILEKIIKDKKEFLTSVKKNNSLDSIEKKIRKLNCFLNFKQAVEENQGVSLIAEIKKASPSAGTLIKDFNHLDIAKIYVDNGATCLSVLTEEKYFLGNLDFISDIKSKYQIPILAKDFFIDPFQVSLSKSYGCDCILIIVAALSESQADEIYAEAIKEKLSVIVEVHTAEEAFQALKYEEAIIGINNRDLKTLKVSIENTLNIYKTIQYHKGPVISESGIRNKVDAQYIYDKTGIKNFLIGESLLINNEKEMLIKDICSIKLK